jgi:phosphate-selective porin OprO and OprP
MAWLVLNTASDGRSLPLKGSAGVTRRTAWIVVASLGVAVAAHAQTAGTAPVPQTVQERVDALAQQLRDLERELGPSGGTAAGTVATRNSTPAAPTANPSPAADAAPAAGGRTVGELQEQVEALDQQVRVLQRQLELEHEKTEQAAKTSAGVTANGPEGFQIKSADGAFTLRLRGYLQSDARFYSNSRPTGASVDTFLLRRVRPLLEGTLFRFVDFRLMPDFGSGTTVLQDAYVDLKFAPWFKVRSGKFKGPVSLERLQSALDIPFVERALPASIAPNRDVGVLVYGDLARDIVNYTVGITNGVTDGSSVDLDDRDGKDVVGRVFVLPFKNSKSDRLANLGLGIAATSGTQRGTVLTPNLPIFRSAGQQTIARYRLDVTSPADTTFADGDHWRISPQGYYYTGPFGLFGEWIHSSQQVRRDLSTATLGTTAWQLTTSYVVTGESASYRGVSPRHAFDTRTRSWGALELDARYHQLQLDESAFPLFANPATSVREARAWAIGANWYLNRAVKIQAQFENTSYKGGSATGDRDTDHEILTRFQVGF